MNELSVGSRFGRSAAQLERARVHLPAGVTSSVRLATRPVPTVFERGSGAELWDADGNRYLDFVLGYGPLLLGHSPRTVVDAVTRQLNESVLSGGQHRLEAAVAEAVVDAIPFAESVCLSSTGSEAVAAAVRLARAFTGRDLLVKFEGHYHGWLDGVAFNTPGRPPAEQLGDSLTAQPATAGVLADAPVAVLRWNDTAMFEQFIAAHGSRVAAVIFEPVPQVGLLEPEPAFLQAVTTRTREAGGLVIFDEVVTGFRIARGGAQERFGVQADLVVLAKALAAGFPVSAVAGRRDILSLVDSGAVTHLGTFNGHAPSLAAANAALAEYRADGFYDRLEHAAARLATGLRELGRQYAPELCVRQVGGMLWTSFDSGPDQPGTTRARATAARSYADLVARADAGRAARFAEGLMVAGVHIQPRGTWMLSAVHDDALIDEALESAAGVLRTLD
ncbi:aminotransferase class III-fold pyridoxal phosphate-dependent enzyme [Kribbella solani]|uniref:aspartate aminotransferase family protein n=1 Tax=Kribbella solani TaxID=236067 RepID=UPI0029ABD14D|nr:aminotransferase class III-fold pyridoxal phosphate-dependent enzyme [Kribbella solani]MDX3005615.1 aminotransferase class III-fold pyridoxal phosphate-dependent enzyme [Kribbella solani]